MRKLAVVLGIPIDLLSFSEALDQIEKMVGVGRVTGKVHQVATVNVDFIVQALRDPELRYLLQQSDLLTADGMPLVWAARYLRAPLEGRVAGADLVPELARRASEHGLSIYFLGGAPGVAATAARLLKEKHPDLKIAGIFSPPFSPLLEMDTSFHADIRAARPDILLVAFGNPKQEKWIGMYGQSLGVPVVMGVGGSLDFIAGCKRRAPVCMQRIGFEWLFRLLQEPRRLFRRYGNDLAIFGSSFLQQVWAMRPLRSHPPHPLTADLIVNQGTAILTYRGCMAIDALSDLEKFGLQALSASKNILVNLAQVDVIDSCAIGMLLELRNQARLSGGGLSLAAVPDRIHHILAQLKLVNLFPTYANIDVFLETHASNSCIQPTMPIAVPSDHRTWMVLKAGRVLDASTAQDFIDGGACALSTNPFLVCDLSETVFLTSAGLSALARLRTLAFSLQGEVRVAGCSEDTLQVIKKSHFDRDIPLYNTFSKAIVA